VRQNGAALTKEVLVLAQGAVRNKNIRSLNFGLVSFAMPATFSDFYDV
jgi:hypothetical protein